MKKWLLILLALCLCCSIASAEISMEVKTAEVRGLSLNETAKTFILRDGTTKMYQVVDADLNPLSEQYADIGTTYGQYEVKDANGARGLLDGQGQVLIAPAYDDIKVISDRWAIGITLKEATAENCRSVLWSHPKAAV